MRHLESHPLATALLWVLRLFYRYRCEGLAQQIHETARLYQRRPEEDS